MTGRDDNLRENLEKAGKGVLGEARTELYVDMRFMASVWIRDVTSTCYFR